jgi:molybdopterin-guanine dinucleotide biosynthesis protein A
LGRGLLASVQGFLSSGQAGVGVWLEQQRLSVVDFSAQSSLFININTLEDHYRWIKA